MGPVLCLISDRRRLGAAWADALVAQVTAAARAGIQMIQVREPDLDGGALRDLVARCVDAVRGTRARVLVNDRLDVALAAGAHGVHLRGDSISAARVRALCPRPFLIGRSVHSVEEVRDADASALDYLILGTVFASLSKPGREPLGTTALAAAVAATTLPVLAVGGVSAETISKVLATGAAGAAAIGAFTTHTGDSVRRLAGHRNSIDTGSPRS